MTNPFLTPEQFTYVETKANIEALTGLVGGERGYATDTGERGHYDAVNSVWVWGGGGTVFKRVLSASLTIADTYCLIIDEYINLQTYDVTLEGDATLRIL